MVINLMLAELVLFKRENILKTVPGTVCSVMLKAPGPKSVNRHSIPVENAA